MVKKDKGRRVSCLRRNAVIIHGTLAPHIRIELFCILLIIVPILEYRQREDQGI